MKPRFSAAWMVLGVLVAGLPWVFWPPLATRDFYVDIKWPVVAFGLLAFGVASFFDRGASAEFNQTGAKTWRSPAPWFLFGGAALVLVGFVLSAAFSPAPGLGFQIALRESLFVLAAVRIATMRIDRRNLFLILGLYIASAAMQAALTLAQWGVSGGTRAAMMGTIGNPEYAAGWMAPALVAAVVWMLSAETAKRNRWLLGVAALVIGVSLVLGGGRGAVLGALAGLAAVGIASRKGKDSANREEPRIPNRRMGLIVGGTALVLIVLLGVLLGPGARHQSIFGRAVETFDPYSISVRHRIGLMIVTSKMILRNPFFGCGPGRFGAAFDRERGEMAKTSEGIGAWVFNDIVNDQTATEAHCDPLQWWAEYGALPFLGLMMVVAGAIAGLAARARQEGNGNAEGAAEARLILGALMVLVVGMMFAFPLHRPARGLLFWVLVGLANSTNQARDLFPLSGKLGKRTRPRE